MIAARSYTNTPRDSQNRPKHSHIPPKPPVSAHFRHFVAMCLCLSAVLIKFAVRRSSYAGRISIRTAAAQIASTKQRTYSASRHFAVLGHFGAPFRCLSVCVWSVCLACVWDLVEICFCRFVSGRVLRHVSHCCSRYPPRNSRRNAFWVPKSKNALFGSGFVGFRLPRPCFAQPVLSRQTR